MNLQTNYMGLVLKNPLVVSSSALTNGVAKIKKLEEAGAGAVVLKSLFEEQIAYESNQLVDNMQGDYPEAYDYIKNYTRNNGVSDYVNLIKEAKSAVSIPVIASIHCYSSEEWVDFARQLQTAGADALELNINILNTDTYSDCRTVEEKYFQIVSQVAKSVTIPVAVKIGNQFSDLVAFVKNLYAAGAKGVVLFNRFFQPDIDIDKMTITSAEVFSSPSDYALSLRWVAIVSGQIKEVHLSASTGIHDGQTVVKQLLAGAQTVQVCSAIYLQGGEVITQMLNDLTSWMTQKGFKEISEFRGRLNYGGIPDQAVYERTQFMKYFASGE